MRDFPRLMELGLYCVAGHPGHEPLRAPGCSAYRMTLSFAVYQALARVEIRRLARTARILSLSLGVSWSFVCQRNSGDHCWTKT